MAQRCSDPPLKVDVLPVVLGEFLRELKDVDWYILGRHLELSQSELREIELNHPNNIGRMRIAMFDRWLRKEEDPSWEKIIAALEEMHETSLASRLNSKYLHKKDEIDPFLQIEDRRSWVPNSQSADISYLYSLTDHSTESANPLHFL